MDQIIPNPEPEVKHWKKGLRWGLIIVFTILGFYALFEIITYFTSGGTCFLNTPCSFLEYIHEEVLLGLLLLWWTPGIIIVFTLVGWYLDFRKKIF